MINLYKSNRIDGPPITSIMDFVPPDLQPEKVIYGKLDGDTELYEKLHNSAMGFARKRHPGNPLAMAKTYSSIMYDSIDKNLRLKREKEIYEKRQAAKAEQERKRQEDTQRAAISSKPVAPAAPAPAAPADQPTGKSSSGEWVNGKWVSSPKQQAILYQYMKAPNFLEVRKAHPEAFDSTTGRLKPGYSVGLGKDGNIIGISNFLGGKGVHQKVMPAATPQPAAPLPHQYMKAPNYQQVRKNYFYYFDKNTGKLKPGSNLVLDRKGNILRINDTIVYHPLAASQKQPNMPPGWS